MTPDHLLPSNATPLEQALSLATDPLNRLKLSAHAIRDFKAKPSDPLLPWLIWEYGLGELLPYLPEPRRAIAEGIVWQRLRGTPAALATALSWIGATGAVEQEPPGVHFAEFQLDPGMVLDSDERIANLIAIARLSAPARSRLSRIYHGYDLRRFVLDASLLGEALLSDHSGMLWHDGQTRLSFGRVRKFALPALAIDARNQREAVRFIKARLLDRVLLDFSVLGDRGHTPNEEILHSHLFTLSNFAGVPDPLGVLPERRFCRAMVVLSSSTSLGDSNANLPRFAWAEEGHPITLGAGDRLSATRHRLIRIEVLQRFDASHIGDLVVPTLTLASDRQTSAAHHVQARGDQHLGTLLLGECKPSFDRGFLQRLHERSNAPLLDAAGWRARRYQRAQVVLSEAVLGDINTRTPRAALHRMQALALPLSLPRLGELLLGQSGAEIESLPLTQMLGRVFDFGALEALVFAPTRSALRRRIAQCSSPLLATAHPSHEHTACVRTDWQGQTWTGIDWPTSSWRDTREVIGSAHHTQI
jgi:P2-related tail formation protein